MASLGSAIRGILAACYIDGAAGTPVYGVQSGFSNAAIVDNGTGDYTLTFQDGVNLATEAVLAATLAGTTSGMVAVEIVSTTQVRVRTFTGANAAGDKAFWLQVYDLGAR